VKSKNHIPGDSCRRDGLSGAVGQSNPLGKKVSDPLFTGLDECTPENVESCLAK
jgi:hypothetical protein